MTIKRAIKLLETEYERAKSCDFVRDPISYALYNVWRIADSEQLKITPKTEAALEAIGRNTHGRK